MSTSLIDSYIIDIEKKFGKKLEVTSSLRTPETQARAMYNHCLAKKNNEKHNLGSYASYKKSMVDDIYAAFERGRSRHDSIILMTETIKKQVRKHQYVSNHLTNSARDIRTRNLSTKEIRELKRIISSYHGIYLNDETNTSQPHFHIHLL